jgi:hypothetical protein
LPQTYLFKLVKFKVCGFIMNSVAHTKSDIKGGNFGALEIFNKLE